MIIVKSRKILEIIKRCIFVLAVASIFISNNYVLAQDIKKVTFDDKPAQKKITPKKKRALPPGLKSDNPAVRIETIKELVKKHNVRAMGIIAKIATKDPDPNVRVTAAWAIAAMDLKMRKELLEFISSSDSSKVVKDEALKYLERLNHPPPVACIPSQVVKNTKVQTITSGGCLKDTDCKGNRICTAPPRYSVGWAKRAGIYGMFATGISAGLSMTSVKHSQDMPLAIPLAGSALVFNVISAAVIASGAKSAKSNPDVTGSLSLRLIGWLSMGFHISGTMALALTIPYHFVNKDENGVGWYPPNSWLIANGVLGFISVFALSMDSFVSHKQAKKLSEKHSNRFKISQISPVISPVMGMYGPTGAVGGVGFAF